MILLLLVWLQSAGVWAEESAQCPTPENFKFVSAELKLNLDGNQKPDVLALYKAGDSLEGCSRRALIFDAPEKLPGTPKPEQWIEAAFYTDPERRAEKIDVEKRTVGDRDLLYVSEEIGNFASFTYYSGEGGKLQKAMFHSHSDADGQVTESYDAKKSKLAVRVFDSGILAVNGLPVDLDQKAIKSRCRVRELHIQIKYEWDSKLHAFKSVEEACVMGNAID